MRNYKFCNHVTATLSLLFIAVLVLLSASPVVAAPISISNATIRDTWTNSLPDPITNDLSPDKFMLNSDRASQIFPSAFLVLPPNPLTMDTGRGEGLIASTQPGDVTFDKELRFGVTAGTGITLSKSVIGLVWNFIDPSIPRSTPTAPIIDSSSVQSLMWLPRTRDSSLPSGVGAEWKPSSSKTIRSAWIR